jgi:magnesium chelatase subunit I
MRPYSQLVRHPGNYSLFSAVELSLLATLAGLPLHLHVEGLRGTGKTTIIRSVRGVLPKIERLRGCPYNCHPASPHCPQHAGMEREELAEFATELVPMPFLEISHSAKVGTVAGSIDLGRLTSDRGPNAALLPGTLARSHRGVVFVDEINRLADTSPELTDLLLDAMGTRPGRLQIEEVGLPTVELPLTVTVWAASNPDEDPGPLEDIRRQLSDRFDLHASMGRIRSRDILLDVLTAGQEALDRQLYRAAAPPRRRSGSPATPAASAGPAPTPAAGVAVPRAPAPDDAGCRFGETLLARAAAIGSTWLGASIRQALADLYLECGLESLRAMEAVQIAARAACAMRSGDVVGPEDLRRAVPLALAHRADPEVVGRFLARLGPEAPAKAAWPGPAGASPQDDETGAANRSRVPPWAPGQRPEGFPQRQGLAAEGQSEAAQAPKQQQGPNAAAGGQAKSLDADGPGHAAPLLAPGEGDRGWLRRLLRSLWHDAGGQMGNPGATAGAAAAGSAQARPCHGQPANLPPTAPPRRARPIAEIPASEMLRMPQDDGPWRER